MFMLVSWFGPMLLFLQAEDGIRYLTVTGVQTCALPISALAVVHLLFFLLDEHEVAKDVEEAVELHHLFPKITRAVARSVLRIPCAALNFAGIDRKSVV